MLRESLIYSFLPLGVITCVKNPYKNKNYSPENKTCGVADFSAIFFFKYLNKITALIFQTIHIQNKSLNPFYNEGVLSQVCIAAQVKSGLLGTSRVGL